ncbi:MAG: cupin domain-containing protein [Azospirillum sp.]|nr:cupin domain-containing protein [Azospirillum sp.]
MSPSPPDRATVILDPLAVPARVGSGYPVPFDALCRFREKRALGDVGGLTNFGVNLVILPPGQASSQRHWHSKQDEFVWILEGEATLITDTGETVVGPGQCACFPAGVPDGHQLVNKSDRPVRYLEVGDRSPGDSGAYPDIDLAFAACGPTYRFIRKDGSPL